MTDRDERPEPDLERVRQTLRETDERSDEHSRRETERDREARERLADPDDPERGSD